MIKKIKTKVIDNKFFFYDENDNLISPFHNINFKNNDLYNIVIEIPKWTRKKMEIHMEDEFNPIVQDIENGKLREYTYGDMLFNYGMMPQTWENPNDIDELSGLPGDGDPIDIIEIGCQQKKIGEILKVKILGVLPLIDQNETDWKIICIDNMDFMADKLNDSTDVEIYLPGVLETIKFWFQKYKLQSKGIEKKFVFDGYGNKKMADQIIKIGHEQYKKNF